MIEHGLMEFWGPICIRYTCRNFRQNENEYKCDTKNQGQIRIFYKDQHIISSMVVRKEDLENYARCYLFREIIVYLITQHLKFKCNPSLAYP